MNTPTLSDFHDFTVGKADTIETLKEGLPISNFCRPLLTTENFGTERSVQSLRGGFLKMPVHYQFKAVVGAVEQLVRTTGRKFRLGTPEEALAYKKQNKRCPFNWVVLGKVFEDRALNWLHAFRHFTLESSLGTRLVHYEIFIAEEL